MKQKYYLTLLDFVGNIRQMPTEGDAMNILEFYLGISTATVSRWALKEWEWRVDQ